MAKFEFGRLSNKRRSGVNKILNLVVENALDKSTIIDFTIPYMGGLRTAEEQNKIFKKGFSKCDGYEKESFHQSGYGLDVAPYKNGAISDDKKDGLLVAKLMIDSFDELQSNGIIPQGVYLHCGIFWGDKDLDNDGFLTEQDKIGWDSRHFEIRTFKQKGTYEIKI